MSRHLEADLARPTEVRSERGHPSSRSDADTARFRWSLDQARRPIGGRTRRVEDLSPTPPDFLSTGSHAVALAGSRTQLGIETLRSTARRRRWIHSLVGLGAMAYLLFWIAVHRTLPGHSSQVAAGLAVTALAVARLAYGLQRGMATDTRLGHQFGPVIVLVGFQVMLLAATTHLSPLAVCGALALQALVVASLPYGGASPRFLFAAISGMLAASAGAALFATAPVVPASVFFASVLSLSAAAMGAHGFGRSSRARLKASEERFALASLGANDGLWDWDLREDHVYYSPRWMEMLGLEDESTIDDSELWFRRVHPEDEGLFREAFDQHASGTSPRLDHELRLRHGGGGYRWYLVRGLAVRDDRGQAVRMVGSLSDITARKRAEESLRREALFDQLTGLANRALFKDRLSSAVHRLRRRKRYLFAVLFLDLDRFKNINDSLGHLVGDELLVALSSRLRSCLRTVDTAARLGGDEFAVLLDEIATEKDATRVSRRIQEAISQPFKLAGQDIYMTASIGIALSSTGYSDAQDVVRDADIAMYRAKAAGKARYVVFDPKMHESAVRLLQLESDLRAAVEREEFHVQYQPIICLRSGRIVGFEALARWIHPDRGFISPGEFIPAAEETGLIVPIGEYVLLEACRQAKRWHLMFPERELISMSVNLSGRQFVQPDLVERIDALVAESGLPPTALSLEITESLLMENRESVEQAIQAIRDRGMQLHIDDFGTGYSSLAYLPRFPVQKLKIDRSFVMRLEEGGEDLVVTRSVADLARNLGLGTVAEGIETEGQLKIIRSLGCGYAQGYYFSRPLKPDAATALLAEDPVW